MTLKVTILGCGGSMGVPIIGNYWGQCDPLNPKNYRTRASIIVEKEGQRLLIDSSPDLRTQLLRENIDIVDAVLYTHAHADHIHGLNDLRAICRNRSKPLDIYADPKALKEIMESFAYAFTPNFIEGMFFKPVLIPHEIIGKFSHGIFDIMPIDQDHGYTSSLGFRIDDFAYSTDVMRLDETAFQQLEGIKIWVVDCIRMSEHPTHASLDTTLSWIERIKPEQAYLTHMSEELDYNALLKILPKNVVPCYDGLILAD
ncbi:MAG: MBL fold metallo-hydrolase [Alphaproteobacteria bacterium]|nr:MBL fold metallo-hydrolase [Alphaproteobacteria bacterium]